MVSHEENTSIVEWFLGPHPFTYPPYGIEMIHEEDEVSHHHQSGEYYREYEDRRSSDVDNDEIIARTLQDDFLQLEIGESNDYSHQHHQQQQQHQQEGYTNNYSNNNNEYAWNDPSALDYSSGLFEQTLQWFMFFICVVLFRGLDLLIFVFVCCRMDRK